MAENNYPKGSYLNPYTHAEHNELKDLNTWYGGWIKESDDSLTYYSAGDNTSYNNGRKDAPYSVDVYNEMQLNGTWLGGWVGQGLVELVDDVYCTTNYEQYCDNDNGVLGSRLNPVPVNAYAEMCRLGLWSSGWVSYDEDSDPYYVGYSTVNNSGGYGCGSGSGEGSGSDGGSGSNSNVGQGPGGLVSPGEMLVGYDGTAELYLAWDEVKNFKIKVKFPDTSLSYYITKGSICLIWNGHNLVTISGEIMYLIRIPIENTDLEEPEYQYEYSVLQPRFNTVTFNWDENNE